MRITTHDNGNVYSHDQEENKLDSTINANDDAHEIEYWAATSCHSLIVILVP